MKKNTNKMIRLLAGIWMCVCVVLAVSSCKKGKEVHEYSHLSHQGEKCLEISRLLFDTLYIHAGATSLEGQWLLKSDRLLYVDKHMVGVREYDLDGHFLRKGISRGKGPDEMYSPFFVSTVTENDELTGLTGMWHIYSYSPQYLWTLPSFPLFSDHLINKENYEEFLRNPQPEQIAIYEYNFNVKKIWRDENRFIVPIVTEHQHFNGYEIKSDAEKFWRTSRIFALIDLEKQQTQKIFGTYPPVYRDKNIPTFSGYDFEVKEGNLYHAFAADSLIYIRDSQGGLTGTMGFASPGVSNTFPETKTFDESETKRREHLKKYGYYTTLKIAGDYLFRVYKKEGKQGYGIQIYKGADFIGDVPTNEEINILGGRNGVYFGELPVDADNEQFRIVKFRL